MYQTRICDKCGVEIERFAPEIVTTVRVLDLNRNPASTITDGHYCSTDCYLSDTKSMQKRALRKITGNDVVNPSRLKRFTASLLRRPSA